MIYLSIIIAIAMAWMLNRSRVGLNLRSVGEDPATADAAGINVIRYKYLFTCIGGGICGEGDYLILPLKEKLSHEIYSKDGVLKTEIRTAALGNDAGIIGAAAFAEAD